MVRSRHFLWAMMGLVALPAWAQVSQSPRGRVFDSGPRSRARLLEGTPSAQLTVTASNEMAGKQILQGLGQLHGLLGYEAERSFRTAEALEPHCVVAYAGMALSNTVSGMGSPRRAYAFLAEGRSILDGKRLVNGKPAVAHCASELEVGLFEAVEKYYAPTIEGKVRHELGTSAPGAGHVITGSALVLGSDGLPQVDLAKADLPGFVDALQALADRFPTEGEPLVLKSLVGGKSRPFLLVNPDAAASPEFAEAAQRKGFKLLAQTHESPLEVHHFVAHSDQLLRKWLAAGEIGKAATVALDLTRLPLKNAKAAGNADLNLGGGVGAYRLGVTVLLQNLISGVTWNANELVLPVQFESRLDAVISYLAKAGALIHSGQDDGEALHLVRMALGALERFTVQESQEMRAWKAKYGMPELSVIQSQLWLLLEAVGQTDRLQAVRDWARKHQKVLVAHQLRGLMQIAQERLDAQATVAVRSGSSPELEAAGPLTYPRPQVAAAYLKRLEIRRPTLIVFEPGGDCTVCVAHADRIRRNHGELDAAGIDLLQVVPEGRAPLVAPLKLAPVVRSLTMSRGALKGFGVIDGFEQVPVLLHGIVFIDAKGRVLWKDVGAQPYADVDGMVREIKRQARISQQLDQE